MVAHNRNVLLAFLRRVVETGGVSDLRLISNPENGGLHIEYQGDGWLPDFCQLISNLTAHLRFSPGFIFSRPCFRKPCIIVSALCTMMYSYLSKMSSDFEEVYGGFVHSSIFSSRLSVVLVALGFAKGYFVD